MSANFSNGSTMQGLNPESIVVRRRLEESLRGGLHHLPKPMVVPIYFNSVYLYEDAAEGKELCNTCGKNGYLYSRWGNPTADVACDTLAELEGAAGSILFSSGSGAIMTTLLTHLKSGDHMIVSRPVFGQLNTVVKTILSKMGVEVTWIEGRKAEDYKEAVKDNTKVLYGECYGNPTLCVLDLEAFGALGQSLPGVVTMVDATFVGPYLLQPIKHGIDFVLHSCSKYIGGHSDLVGGAVSFAKEEYRESLNNHMTIIGTNMSPFDAFMVQRSLKTLAVRMDRHCQNAMAVAEYLQSHSKVSRVFYPGLESHKDHKVAKKLMKKGFSGMVSFELKGSLEDGIKFVESTKLIIHTVSLGGVESLICHPAATTHCDTFVSPEEKRITGITDTLIRISVGVESVEDLIKDLEQALDQV